MAHTEHLAQIKQGIQRWNLWRTEQAYTFPDLSAADLNDATLTDANLTRSRLNGAHLLHANLSHADLSEANLSGADLSYADLSGANLSNADLSHAQLRYANLNGANLNRANLTGTQLSHTQLHDTNLNRATIAGTLFVDIDLSSTKGLDNLKFNAPATIGIDTLYRSQGKISDHFLKDAGVPELFISTVHALAKGPAAYPTCCISYADGDEAVARQLSQDLQYHHVPCWFASQERQPTTKSKQPYDKLIVILSALGVTSPVVEHAVKTAKEREQRPPRRGKQQSSLLVPISVDLASDSSEAGWVTDLHRDRRIIDFTGWKDHDAYQVAFQHILVNLQASA